MLNAVKKLKQLNKEALNSTITIEDTEQKAMFPSA